ncbi:hypothetical protein PA10_00020 [Pseudomonas phage pPa_SNUABM_DT01]|nr:hypothetical protein PA10_00020 [Pseudomonas phage pPa_SNUABM_DT01]
MARNTPPMNVSGAFLLRSPFVADPAKSYTVTALRSFAELVARGQDPLKLIYLPVNLSETNYAEDQLEGALVVALRDSTGKILYVPDTWIDRYPNMGSVPYSRLVAAIDLGMWPDARDLDDVEQAIKESIRSKIGVDVEVKLTRGIATDFVSEERHVQLTQARENAVTNNETYTATIIRLSDEIARKDVTIAEQAELIQALANP